MSCAGSFSRRCPLWMDSPRSRRRNRQRELQRHVEDGGAYLTESDEEEETEADGAWEWRLRERYRRHDRHQ